MSLNSRVLVVALVGAAAALAGSHAAAQRTPTFRAGVDLVAVDVQVVTSNGLPIGGLGPERFEVTINGRRRRVVSAELVRHGASGLGSQPAGGHNASLPAGPARPEAVPVAAVSSEGRVYVIAIDLMSFRAGATQLVTSAARGFIEKLRPTDLVGLAAFPTGPELDATTDHAAIIRGLDTVVGIGEPAITAANRFGLNPSNIVDITAAAMIEPYVDLSTAPPGSNLRRVGEAVCSYDKDPDFCRRWIVSDAQSLAVYEEGLAIQRLGAVRALLSALARASGRKTVVLVSAGFPATDISGGRPDLGELGLLVGQEAARANSTIYALHVDTRRTELGSASSSTQLRPTNNQARDSTILGRPLEQVAALSGGALFTVVQGGGEFAFDRIRAETSSLYMLGVEPDDSDRTGVPRQLNVKVNSGQRGSIVRARSWVVVPRPGSAPLPARTSVMAPAPTPPAPTPPPPSAPAPPAVAVAAAPASAPRTTVDDFFTTYTSGDRNVLLRELSEPAAFERVRPDLVSVLARWRTDWSPVRAAFAMEIAFAAYARRWPNPDSFLQAARSIVVGRPDPPGSRLVDDQVELRFHRVAVAMLAAAVGPRGVESYLTSIQDRVALGRDVPKGAVLKDARLLMARAMAREAEASRSDELHAWMVAKDDGTRRRELEGVADLLELAEADDEARAEASVRRAFVLHRLGAHYEALALLDTTTPRDDVVEYWRALIQGRAYLAASRNQNAVAAFKRAFALVPDAQTPAVALAAIFLKLGDRQQAQEWAARARTTKDSRDDPWSLYWSGSSRFLERWLTDLRSQPQ